jgi:hypothetical protein
MGGTRTITAFARPQVLITLSPQHSTFSHIFADFVVFGIDGVMLSKEY